MAFFFQQKIDAKFRASLFHHKAHHIGDEPGGDQHDKHGGETDHDLHHILGVPVLSKLVLEEQAVEGVHQCTDKSHGEKVDQIVSGGSFHIAECEL